jgi:hypothetical protein
MESLPCAIQHLVHPAEGALASSRDERQNWRKNAAFSATCRSELERRDNDFPIIGIPHFTFDCHRIPELQLRVRDHLFIINNARLSRLSIRQGTLNGPVWPSGDSPSRRNGIFFYSFEPSASPAQYCSIDHSTKKTIEGRIVANGTIAPRCHGFITVASIHYHSHGTQPRKMVSSRGSSPLGGQSLPPASLPFRSPRPQRAERTAIPQNPCNLFPGALARELYHLGLNRGLRHGRCLRAQAGRPRCDLAIRRPESVSGHVYD